MSTGRIGKLLLDKYCLASEREETSMIPTLSLLSRKVLLSDTPPHLMRIFAVKTFANCPKTAKFVKVFTCERLPLYGMLGRELRHWSISCS